MGSLALAFGQVCMLAAFIAVLAIMVFFIVKRRRRRGLDGV